MASACKPSKAFFVPKEMEGSYLKPTYLIGGFHHIPIT
jgi:predicted transcriptional regulator